MNPVESNVDNSREPRWVAIRAADGRFLGGRMSYAGSVQAGDSVDLFDREDLPDGAVAFRSLATSKYLSAAGGVLTAAAAEAGETECFTLIEQSGRCALRAPGGRGFLSCAAGDDAACSLTAVAEPGDGEWFTIEPLEMKGAPGSGHGCCSAWSGPSEVTTAWEDQSHEKILDSAVACIRAAVGVSPEIGRFLELWDTNGKTFEARVKKGLNDADYEYPWQGNYITGKTYTWHDHFYNPGPEPNRERNYLGGASSAVTEGRRYFNLSVYAAMRALHYKSANRVPPPGLYDEAAYYLGLSLHFLTDLTQPMHSANFTNGLGENTTRVVRLEELIRMLLRERRHSKFETYAEGRVVSGNYLDNYAARFPLSREDADISAIQDAGSFLHQIAVRHRRIFDDDLIGPLREMGLEGEIVPAKIDPVLDKSLLLAPKIVARFLLYWSLCTRQSWNHIDSTSWYRIVEPTRGEWIALDDDHHYRRQLHDDGRDLLFFIFNDDGTWSIGCRSYVHNIWYGYTRGGLPPYAIDQYEGPDREPPASSRFRMVPNGRPDGDRRVWIFEDTKHPWAKEVVAVVTSLGRDGDLTRWEPVDPPTQLFTLQKMRPMSTGEIDTISERWPAFRRNRQWYGA